jgi:hypothetical protein
MNKNKQRIAIAEACGYKDLETRWSNYHQWECPDGRIRFGTLNDKYACLPDYLNDLDSMHEAVSIFDYDQADEFDDHLCDICRRSNDLADNPTPWRFAVTNATAAQRAEAFLRTLHLWEE